MLDSFLDAIILEFYGCVSVFLNQKQDKAQKNLLMEGTGIYEKDRRINKIDERVY